MNLLQRLQTINPNFLEFITQEVVNEEGLVLGVKCFGVEKGDVIFAGGTAQDKDLALRIAIAEAFERSYLDLINKDQDLARTFDMKNFPSSSGFAAGFDQSSTRFRAICEGLERWIWSKWIDEQFSIPRDLTIGTFDPLTKHLLKSFDETHWFKKDFVLEVTPTEKLNLTIVIFLGCSEDGIFAGSRVSSKGDALYQHPVIEAHRNYSNAKIHKIKQLVLEDIIQERTIFFSSNKKCALEQVGAADTIQWPTPMIHLLERYETNSEVCLYRCLMKDFIGWHLGPVERFVY